MTRYVRRPLRRSLPAAAAVVALALIAGCGAAGDDDPAAQLTGDQVRIVSINDDTADHPETDVIAAGEAAVDYVNENGGINGRPLEIEFCNGQLDPNATAACANQAVSDPSVIATVGNFMVAGSGAVQSFSDAGLAELSPFSVSLAEYSCPVCSNTVGGAILSGLGAATALADAHGATQLAFVGVDTPANRGVPDLIGQVLDTTGRAAEIVSAQFVPYGSADFNGIVAGLQGSGADGVILGVPLNLQLSFLRAASSQGLEMRIGSNLSVNLLPELPAVGSSVDNLVLSTFYRHDLPGYQTFVDQLAESDPDIGPYADIPANMWSGVLMFAEIARGLPELTREGVVEAARSITDFDSGMTTQPVDLTRTFDGLGGSYSGLTNTTVYYGHVENGELVYDLDGRAVDVFGGPAS